MTDKASICDAHAGVHMGKVLLEIGSSQERLSRNGVHPAVRGPLAAAPGQEAATPDVEIIPSPIQVSISVHAQAPVPLRALPQRSIVSPFPFCVELQGAGSLALSAAIA